MRAWAWALCVALGAACASGCWHRGERPPLLPPVGRGIAPVQHVEGIYLESVILERPVGDKFLDRELWSATLPIGTPETRVILTENGLRAAILAGTPPQRFQTLLESDAETLNARGLTFAMRKEEVLPTSGPHERCEFSLLADLAGKRSTVAFKQARCGILVRPEAVAGGRVKITCEPQIQHGERREWWRPSEDGTGFVKYDEIPLASYPTLSFEATLGRNEYLVIGWPSDQNDTIGSALFAVEANNQPRQRVLVVRAHQVSAHAGSDLPQLAGNNRRPSVAAEAARPR